jgi:hypothetical protein
MSNKLSRSERYIYLCRYMSSEYRRLAAKDCSRKTPNYYLRMAENYNRLAETREQKRRRQSLRPKTDGTGRADRGQSTPALRPAKSKPDDIFIDGTTGLVRQHPDPTPA